MCCLCGAGMKTGGAGESEAICTVCVCVCVCVSKCVCVGTILTPSKITLQTEVDNAHTHRWR